MVPESGPGGRANSPQGPRWESTPLVTRPSWAGIRAPPSLVLHVSLDNPSSATAFSSAPAPSPRAT